MWTGGFPEPLTFSLRARRHLAARRGAVRRRPRQPDPRLRAAGHGAHRLPAGDHHPPPDHRRPPVGAGRRRRLEAPRSPCGAGTASPACRSGSPGGCRPCSPSPAPRARRSSTTSASGRDRVHVVHIGADTDLFSPDAAVPVVPGRIVTTSSADVPLKGLVHLVEALAKVRTENPDAHLVVVGKRAEDGPVAAAIERATGSRAPSSSSRASPTPSWSTSSASAQIACVPSLYEGFSLPAAEAMATGTPLVATTGGAIPEVGGPGRRDLPRGAARRRGRARRRAWAGCWATPPCAGASAPPGRERVLRRFTWAQAAQRHGRALPRGDRRTGPRRPGPRRALSAARLGLARDLQLRPDPTTPPDESRPRADRRLLPLPARRRRSRARPRAAAPDATPSSATGAVRRSSRSTRTARRSARSPSGSPR